jgi:hypothetical protein
MYPQSALILLTARKDALRREIAERREQCATVAVRVTQPLVWLDRALMLGHALGSISIERQRSRKHSPATVGHRRTLGKSH